ncbi:probable beta-1,4-xylosyltransferase IRX14H [Telopea speciosissima]|uniref:probable beta-1,4-xylosyltransferase IRX14H n=1 Tax=Telopea speciosissima TaxID=54955 RepID=UPI001CC3ECEE|nr:probable beta-1,4-xylosyltransferase IRX14H [Telopea speciosissima]
MKLSVLQQNCNTRRNNSFRANGPLETTVDGSFKSPAALFWLVLHGLCCLISLVMGFRFSRLIIFLLFSTNNNNSPSVTNHLYTTTRPLLTTTTNVAAEGLTSQTPPSTPTIQNPDTTANRTTVGSRVVVGRHGILIRPWPHPDPAEVMKAHLIMERVQREQRLQYGIKSPRPLIVITPTYVRTFQTLHLTGLVHSLMLAPYDLTWIVVEAGGITNETTSLLAKSSLRTIHIGFDQRMPITWENRHRMEARMRLRALRVVREQRLDGIVVFADDSNMHSMELFDEIQSVKWIGAVSVGILAHSGNPDEFSTQKQDDENSPLPIQGPACNSSGSLVGWHTFNSLPYAEKSATYIGDSATVLPRKLEWSGFVLNSRLFWKEAENKPDWVKDLDTLERDGGDLESPLSLLKDASVVEPLGSCGRKVLLWWLRVEARADSKFPPGWIIDSPLEITVPAKHTPWPDAPPEFMSGEKVGGTQEHMEKHTTKTGRVSRPKHGRHKKKRESRITDTQVSQRRSAET